MEDLKTPEGHFKINWPSAGALKKPNKRQCHSYLITTVAVLMNLIFRENVMVKQHVIKEWPAGKSSRISPRNSIHASRITSGLKETSAECRQASFRRSCLDKGCHSKGDWLIVAIVARELSSSKNRKKKLGTSKIKRNAYNECKDRFQLIHKIPMEPQLNLKGTKICQFILLL